MSRLVPSELRMLARTPSGRVLVGVVAAIAVATVVGLVALWPQGEADVKLPSYQATESGKVVSSAVRPCGPTAQDCRSIRVRAGATEATIELGPDALTPTIGVGAKVRVSRVPGEGADTLQFVDLDRRVPILLWALLLAVVAVVALWWRGMLALIGVGLSLALVTLFLIPAILDGESALLVGLVAALAVTFITTTLTNGLGAQTLAAVLGVSATLVLTVFFAYAAVQIGLLDGRSDETSVQLGSAVDKLSLQGIVIASMLIGALGVLADTAVTQASAVMALRRANPGLPATGLYKEAFVVGRDHLSATIHTLVLAYVGSALPLLLSLRAINLPLTDGVNSQAVAQPVLAAIVGCIALIFAVPITTGLASVLVSRIPVAAVPAGHGHAH